jgi:hypothetical protein
MEAGRLPAAVLSAARDRRGGATEVAAKALDGLLEVAGDPALVEESVAVLLAGQPAMAPLWHVARAARAADPGAALAELRRRLDEDADAAVAAASAWLRQRLAGRPGTVATVSHSSLVDRVLAQLGPAPAGGGSDPRWGSIADPGEPLPRLPTGSPGPHQAGAAEPVVAVVGADAIGPGAFLNASGTGELAARLPTLVVATAIKLVPAEPFGRLAGPGFEAVPLDAVAAVVVGAEALTPAEAGRRARDAGQAGPPPRR